MSIKSEITGFVDSLYQSIGSDIVPVLNGEKIDGSQIGCPPERFTYDNLIEPILSKLGYDEIVSEPYVGPGRQRADFWIRTDKVDVIGECKSPNNYSKINKQLAEYLGGMNSKLSYGIATDGLRWGVYYARPRFASPMQICYKSLRPGIIQYAFTENYIDEQKLDVSDNKFNYKSDVESLSKSVTQFHARFNESELTRRIREVRFDKITDYTEAYDVPRANADSRSMSDSNKDPQTDSTEAKLDDFL